MADNVISLREYRAKKNVVGLLIEAGRRLDEADAELYPCHPDEAQLWELLKGSTTLRWRNPNDD